MPRRASGGGGGVGSENGGREEAGITILYSDYLHQDIGIIGGSGVNGTDEGRQIVSRTIVHAQQVGPWALGSDNNTVIAVSVTLVFLPVFLSLSGL